MKLQIAAIKVPVVAIKIVVAINQLQKLNQKAIVVVDIADANQDAAAVVEINLAKRNALQEVAVVKNLAKAAVAMEKNRSSLGRYI